MESEEPMNIDERRKYLHKMQQRYWQAIRTERSRLLDEMEQVTGLQWKTGTTLRCAPGCPPFPTTPTPVATNVPPG
jgi:hypothetical protein